MSLHMQAGTLTRAERRYCATRKEMLALVWASHHFRSYLYGRKFVLRTDYSALQWLHSLKEPEGQVARWLEGMAEFNYDVVHRPGKQHCNADALSRGQCHQCGLDFSCTEFEEEEEVMIAAEDSILPVWSNQDIRNLQKADTNLRTVMEWVESGITPQQCPQNSTWQLKSLWTQKGNLEVKDGILYRQ